MTSTQNERIAFFLREGGKLSSEPPRGRAEPQAFTSDPRADAIRRSVPKAVFETEPFSQGVEVTGPLALCWHASIESKGLPHRTWRSEQVEELRPAMLETDWCLKLFDVDVDGSVRCPAEGWLKASHYELNEAKSKPCTPYHPHTRKLPIKPGEVTLYASGLKMTSNLFLAGHGMRLEISAQDRIQDIWYHLPHMDVVRHAVYCDESQPSYLLLHVIPKGYAGAGEPAYPPAGPFDLPKYERKR